MNDYAAWRQFSGGLGGEFEITGRFLKNPRIKVLLGNWTLIAALRQDTSQGNTVLNRKHAAFEVSFVGDREFQLDVTRVGLITKIARRLGARGIQVGDPDFDSAFEVKSKNSARVQALLADSALRGLIANRGWRVLRVTKPRRGDPSLVLVTGEIRRGEELRECYQLAESMMTALVRVGAASDAPPR